MTSWQKTIFIFLGGSIVLAYLFASAPAPLPDMRKSDAPQYSVNKMFEILAVENTALRSLYTTEIVEQGKVHGLNFGEDWESPGVEAGPLPALFLRRIAEDLEKSPEEISLFLGSDFPVSEANRFSLRQLEVFRKIRVSGQPQFFFDEDVKRYIAMFPDYAITAACVNCHNAHPQSFKRNWKVGDIMGATTWMYPKDSLSLEEIKKIVAQFRASARQQYQVYVDKASAFSRRPLIDSRWPRTGFALPRAEVFMDSVSANVSPKTLKALLY